MNTSNTPEFAVIGHPNEGKSSVVSTLAEDDSVRVSPYPGETTQCRIFPVRLDGKEIVRFIDTPGFQMPGKTLEWFKNYTGTRETSVQAFITANKKNEIFRDECELLSPIANGAGIIYVADGSRPVRKNDFSEMAILDLTGLPGMAIINCKSDDTRYLEEWKTALTNHFDSISLFNAHLATCSERIALLETLKNVDPRWNDPVGKVISAFREDWEKRNIRVAELVCSMIEQCLSHRVTGICNEKPKKEKEKKKLQKTWNTDIEKIEKKTHQTIRKLYKHNIFNIDLPAGSIAAQDLFDSSTWRVLGLSKAQLAVAAATCGGTAAAVLDLAFAGHSLGAFALVGGVVGAGSVFLGADKIAKTRVVGKSLGGYQLTIGPVKNIQLMYILIDRALIVYSHIINWAHGKRGVPEQSEIVHDPVGVPGYTSGWNSSTKRVFNQLFSELQTDDPERKDTAMKYAVKELKSVLDGIPEKKFK